MSEKSIFSISQEDKEIAVERLVERSALNGDFLVMLVLSCFIVTIGILLRNTSVLIGGMLVTPLLFPPLGLALSIVTGNKSGIYRGAKNILFAILIVLVVSILISFLFFGQTIEAPIDELAVFTRPNLLFIFVALASGIAAAFSVAKPQLSEALPGVAVSVALLPPLAMVGVGLAKFSFSLSASSLQLFLINLIGIIFGSIVVFSLMNFFQARRIEQEEIKLEEQMAKPKNGSRTLRR